MGIRIGMISAFTLCLTAAIGSAASASNQAPAIRHVFLIVLENKNYADTFATSKQDAYLQKILPQQGALLTRYYGTGHSSLDNYIAMISGQASTRATEVDCADFADFALKEIDRDDQAVGTGCVYPGEIKTLADQLESAGLTWKAYMEDMGNDPARETATCGHPVVNTKDQTQAAEAPREGLPTGDQYAVRHNPFMYFHSIIDDQPDCARRVVNLSALTDDLRSVHTTPNFAFITPNLCNDGHDGDGTGTAGKRCVDGKPGGLTSSDAFLRTWVPRILNSPAYQQGGLLIITFDEGDFSPPETTVDPVTRRTTVTISAPGEHCCGQRIGPNITRPVVQRFIESPTLTYLVKIRGYGGDRIGAVLLSPFIHPGTLSDRPYNHYSLLRSIEDMFRLSHLGYAAQSDLATFGKDVFGD
jgi:phosphatidylinositol-3-phosphatase